MPCSRFDRLLARESKCSQRLSSYRCGRLPPAVEDIDERLDAGLDVVREEKAVVAFEREDGQAQRLAENDVADAAVAERLHVMDDPVDAAAIDFPPDVGNTAVDGVGVGIVRVLLGERAAGRGERHGKLALHLVENYPRPALLDKRIKVLRKDRRHADIGKPQLVIGKRPPLFRSGNDARDVAAVGGVIPVEVRARHEPEVVLEAAHPVVFPGQAVELVRKLPAGPNLFPHLFARRDRRAEVSRQTFEGLPHRLFFRPPRIGELDDF